MPILLKQIHINISQIKHSYKYNNSFEILLPSFHLDLTLYDGEVGAMHSDFSEISKKSHQLPSVRPLVSTWWAFKK